jgi:thiamine-monophosphate kinase
MATAREVRSLSLAETGERRFLELIRPYLASSGPEVVVGVGDDAAVISSPYGCDSLTVLTTDMLIEGTHFPPRDRVEWAHLGHKAMAANLSDVAAMGAQPRFALVSLSLPPNLRVGDVLDLYEGMHALAVRHGTGIIGGDTVGAPVVAISITVLGTIPPPQRPALRSACRPGQTVYVSGALGGSLAGLLLTLDDDLRSQVPAAVAEPLIERHWRPEPRVELGLALAATVPDLAMIDISDSLSHELSLLAEASRVGFALHIDRVPVPEKLDEFCRCTGRARDELLLFSGEEYELLFTTSQPPEELTASLRARGADVPVTAIGSVTAQAGRIEFFSSGRVVEYDDRTFDHFRKSG